MIEVINNLELEGVLSSMVNKKKLIVLDFFAAWCTPCKKIAQVLNNIEEGCDSSKVIFVKKDVSSGDNSDNQIILQKYDIKSVPLLLLIRDGLTVGRVEGFKNEQFVQNLINYHLHLNQ
jgi:thioredoxin 1